MAEIFILEGKVSYCFILVIAFFLANSVAFSRELMIENPTGVIGIAVIRFHSQCIVKFFNRIFKLIILAIHNGYIVGDLSISRS